jgi:hypothetical protein
MQKRLEAQKVRLQSNLNRDEAMRWPWLSDWEAKELGVAGLWGLLGLVVTVVVIGLKRLTKTGLTASERGLLIYSENLAAKLDYELTRTLERGFELSPVSWVKGTSKSSNQEKARGLSLPELTSNYIEFVSNVLRVIPGKLLICIDELDKVTDLDQVRFILREIKGALYVKGTFYVLSISNDALRSFEGRMGDQRDIFESTFDDVFAVRPLEFEACLDILNSRINKGIVPGAKYGASPETLATLSVFSAGNARDLIRGFREYALSCEEGRVSGPEETWNLLFSRRREAISDRANSAGGSSELRRRVIPILSGQAFWSTNDDDQLKGLKTCCSELNSYLNLISSSESIPKPEELAIAQRFLRYAVEIQILLQTKQRVTKTQYGAGPMRDAAVIMAAYQMLPFNTGDAESILCRLDCPDEEERTPCVELPTPPVSNLVARHFRIEPKSCQCNCGECATMLRTQAAGKGNGDIRLCCVGIYLTLANATHTFNPNSVRIGHLI